MSKPFYQSKILWLAFVSFLIQGLPIITQGAYTDWRVVANGVVIPILILISRLFFTDTTITLPK